MKQEELEAQLKHRKEKKELEDESFVDKEMIYSFITSAIIHVIIIYWGWYGLMYYFGESYERLIKKINATPDIILRLRPDNSNKNRYK